ncbi:hypothetical protein QCE63_35200 [Caballeronia sp. LZ065]|uniref:hypothetical protein n=1 Tax=Caballeronia sp. LZ065 TaxID=3038571 RepID=UPI002855C00F|nr:hypothetical protein [Caballeronia sp. LZ065]MDR5784644.1 hypothetical protein [Caballeronia sp. LZ065]
MTLEELNGYIAECKAAPPAAPQLTVAQIRTTAGYSAATLDQWAAEGAPINLTGKTDLFALFDWLNAPGGSYANAVIGIDDVLRCQWIYNRSNNV